jgi:hypothetical protein
MNKPTYEELLSQRDYFKNGMAELQDIIDKMQTERDGLTSQVAGLNKANSKLSQIASQQGRINQLEAALDCLQFAAHLNPGVCANLDKTLADTLVIHNNMQDEAPASCLAQLKADAVESAVKFFHPARDIDAEALQSYAERIRQEVL